ncbi:MAG: hypothetical protein NC548_22375 [Lachnospiraceae bacterium]|nr:hypothetical protein [Lachnospiraceae bacterium]
MRVKGTKANRRFSYDGNKGLEAETQKAREELEKKITAAQRDHLRWAYKKAKKEYEAYEQRITDLKDFIYAAEKEMERQKAEGSGENA